jgi:mannose-1-phosphate guanylyltransferase
MTDVDSKTYVVIMAGGAGTRFWPASRSKLPKQLLPLLGGDKSMLEHTVSRIAALTAPERVFVVTGESIGDATAAVLKDVPQANILREPIGRNTAPCVGWATWKILQRDPEARIVVLPSDQHIENHAAFVLCLQQALAAADSGYLTTLGILPTRPETGYGYIELGGSLEGSAASGARLGKRFVEKPSKVVAEQYLASGNYLWNAGMFFFRARVMQAAIQEHLPDLADGLDSLMRDESKLAEVFPTLPSISIDHGVMEKASRIAVVPGDFGWSDVGSFLSAWELAPKDAAQNSGEALFIDGSGNYVANFGSEKTIALIGVSDLVVVHTEDAILVVPRERSQDVKLAIEKIRAAGDPKRVL